MNDTAAPLVSVVIATFNRADTLGEAIDSALSQCYPNVEVIVVDDGSFDGTQELLRRYGSRIVTHRQANRGYASARNAGFRLARGKYVAWLDSDDVFMPEKTALQVAFLEAHDDVVLISSEFSGFDARGPRPDSVRTYYGVFGGDTGPGSTYAKSKLLDPGSVAWLRATTHPVVRVWTGHVVQHLLKGSFVHPPTVIMRRDAAAQAGELDETLANSVEYEFLFRLARIGAFAFIDHELVRYRFSTNQLSGAAHADSMSLSILRILQELPRTQPDVVAAAPALYWSRLAACHLRVACVFAEIDRGLAVRESWKALRLGHVDPTIINIWARILLPATAIDGVRRLKRVVANLGKVTGSTMLAWLSDVVPETTEFLVMLS